MRWKRKPWPTPGTVVVARHFAWLPVTINMETRWLEWCTVRKRYIRCGDWELLKFIDGVFDDTRAT